MHALTIQISVNDTVTWEKASPPKVLGEKWLTNIFQPKHITKNALNLSLQQLTWNLIMSSLGVLKGWVMLPASAQQR